MASLELIGPGEEWVLSLERLSLVLNGLGRGCMEVCEGWTRLLGPIMSVGPGPVV